MATIKLDNVDWEMLRRQKRTLVEFRGMVTDAKALDDLSGLVHLLDEIQDQAADQIGEKEVFGAMGED